jgi:NAD(P)-dependent dehydrogenase (short-subunit alcohol dehydrogenase family)
MKNILITGASQGIGKATAIEAAKAKMFVGINYNQNAKAADECLAEVQVSWWRWYNSCNVMLLIVRRSQVCLTNLTKRQALLMLFLIMLV